MSCSPASRARRGNGSMSRPLQWKEGSPGAPGTALSTCGGSLTTQKPSKSDAKDIWRLKSDPTRGFCGEMASAISPPPPPPQAEARVRAPKARAISALSFRTFHWVGQTAAWPTTSLQQSSILAGLARIQAFQSLQSAARLSSLTRDSPYAPASLTRRRMRSVTSLKTSYSWAPSRTKPSSSLEPPGQKMKAGTPPRFCS